MEMEKETQKQKNDHAKTLIYVVLVLLVISILLNVSLLYGKSAILNAPANCWDWLH